MKIILISEKDSELKLEVQGEGHTLLNLLQQILMNYKNVESVGYDVPHRLVDSAVFHIKTKGKDNPVSTIIKASKEIKESAEEFEIALENACKSIKK